jgi:hypothetical protein
MRKRLADNANRRPQNRMTAMRKEKVTCSRLLVSSVSGTSGIASCATTGDLDLMTLFALAFGWLAAEDEDSSCIESKL